MMSSKIVKIYYLTEYRFGRTMLIWPKLRYRAISANAVSTLGFHAKGMMRNPKFAQSASRLIGTLRASLRAKRQSARNRRRPEVATPSRLTAKKLLCQNDARLVKASRAVTFTINNVRVSRGCCLTDNPNHPLLLGRGAH
jgi:hypothetical protein